MSDQLRWMARTMRKRVFEIAAEVDADLADVEQRTFKKRSPVSPNTGPAEG